MNIVLFDECELGKPLPSNDRRTRHIVEHLRKQPGDRIKAGVVNRALGWLHIQQFDELGMHYSFEPTGSVAPASYPITVLIGHPRPPAARRLLIDLTALGIAHMVFFCADNSEKSYADSSLWNATTTTQLLKQGLEYAGAVQLPTAAIAQNLSEGLRTVDTLRNTLAWYRSHRWCCVTQSDYVAIVHTKNLYTAIQRTLRNRQNNLHPNQHVILAIGAERGWTNNELTVLKKHHYEPCTIGRRTVRTETAAICAVGVTLAALTSNLRLRSKQSTPNDDCH